MNMAIWVIFIITFGAGISVLVLKEPENKNFKNLLSLSGAYLFSITIIHLLPEIFRESSNSLLAGVFVLLGFFMQQLLGLFTEGVEHGHVHHHHSTKVPFLLIFSLIIHSLLEGSLLVHHSVSHVQHENNTILWGLVMHKIPEAFTLGLVLFSQIKSKNIVLFWLFMYALASPMGILASEYFTHLSVLNEQNVQLLFALVAGNFLHIATTIFFEAAPGHQFKLTKAAMSILGASLAVLAEFIL